MRSFVTWIPSDLIARRSDAMIHLVHVFSMLDALGAWEQLYHHKVIGRLRDEKFRYMDSVRSDRATLGCDDSPRARLLNAGCARRLGTAVPPQGDRPPPG